jgi:uncharacterized protein (TIGR03000 family)
VTSYGGLPTVITQAPPASSTVVSTNSSDTGGLRASPNRALIVAQVPADADLYIDGVRVALGSTRRVITSPDLQPGRDYVYTLKARTIRNGKEAARTKQVTVRPGTVTNVAFNDLNAGVPAQLKVELPSAARLYVNDALVEHPTTPAIFTTPALEPGKPYHYVLRVELNQGGKTRTAVRTVKIEAGKRTEVRFDDLAPWRTAQR